MAVQELPGKLSKRSLIVWSVNCSKSKLIGLQSLNSSLKEDDHSVKMRFLNSKRKIEEKKRLLNQRIVLRKRQKNVEIKEFLVIKRKKKILKPLN